MAFATIDVTKGITGTIPVANGGTGLTSGTSGQFLKFTGSTTLASAADNGKVIQIVNTPSVGGNNATTSTSYIATGVTLSITPTKASSKIYLLYSIPTNVATANSSTKTKVYRQVNSGGFSSVSDFSINNHVYMNGASSVSQFSTVQWLDTPTYSLTDVLHYKLYFASSDGGNVNIYNEGGNRNNLTLMEIAA